MLEFAGENVVVVRFSELDHIEAELGKMGSRDEQQGLRVRIFFMVEQVAPAKKGNGAVGGRLSQPLHEGPPVVVADGCGMDIGRPARSRRGGAQLRERHALRWGGSLRRHTKAGADRGFELFREGDFSRLPSG